MSDAETQTPAPAYQVLARKYRPETFADLVGQEAMVRTLKNAFAADRIAICIREIQDSGMDVSFDFSRHGFMTITGTR